MQLKHAVCTAALAVPLLLAGASPSAADVDVGFGVGSPYYGSPYWGPDDGYYGPGFYGPGYYRHGWGPGYGFSAYDDEVFLGARVDLDDADEDDEAVIVVEPTAADPAPCVKTNVKNLKNACPM
jgi:hypothetical protein